MSRASELLEKQAISEKTNPGVFEMQLLELLLSDDAADLNIRRVETFSEDGVLTANKGLVVLLNDGTKFHLEIKV